MRKVSIVKKEVNREEVQAWVQERFELSVTRIRGIAKEHAAASPFGDYFNSQAAFILHVENIYKMRQDGGFARLTTEALAEMNHCFYADILPETEVWAGETGYEKSYANPQWSTAMLGADYGPMMAWLVTEIRGLIPLAFQGRLADMTAINELFIEIYNRFENRIPERDEILQIIYWYVSDYSDQTVTGRTREKLDPALSFYRDIIMKADLTDLSYLYQYGEYISANEKSIAAYLNTLDQSVIDDMAATFVNGYVRGFELYKIDLSAKKNVQLRANIGFERVLRSTIRQFEALGLSVIVCRDAIHSINKTAGKLGLVSCSANPQYDYDHRMDKGLYLDKALCERIIGVTKSAYEQYADLAEDYAGPAWMDVFGETPFEPAAKEENIRLSDKQQRLAVRMAGQMTEIVNQYIDASAISFSIIAWPLPSIGDRFEAIMDETIKVNNLDNDLFRSIQQKMIDAIDGAEYMHITGMNGNRTDLKVAFWQLQDPAKETVFENCCADVNIPVGEIFTSPVLAGTNGTLHVSSVYLNGLNYRNLSLRFEDGCVAEADCSNYEDREENQKYLRQNLLQNHETLPMGEFAIGTNTTAYAMARKFDITQLMPILIMEKTGPHFAIGDTCYSHSEDHKVYNTDGKEIVARENEKSRLRDTDPEQAYFNVHTDITIPYDEISAITACFADGRQVDIIREGKFCLEGTGALNEPLNI